MIIALGFDMTTRPDLYPKSSAHISNRKINVDGTKSLDFRRKNEHQFEINTLMAFEYVKVLTFKINQNHKMIAYDFESNKGQLSIWQRHAAKNSAMQNNDFLIIIDVQILFVRTFTIQRKPTRS